MTLLIRATCSIANLNSTKFILTGALMLYSSSPISRDSLAFAMSGHSWYTSSPRKLQKNGAPSRHRDSYGTFKYVSRF